MNNLPKISIITPTFNSEKFILNNLTSVNNQTLTNYEQIIIDNSSSDNTINIIKNFKSEKIKLISETDNGIYEAINKGIKLARGDIISILHSDDQFYDQNVLDLIIESFEKYNTEIVYGNLVYISKNDPKKVVRVWLSNHYIANSFHKGWSPPHPSFFVKKEIYNKYGFYLNELGNPADIELMYRFLEIHKIKNTFINSFFIKMRLGGKSNKSIIGVIKQNLKIIEILNIKNIGILKFMIFKFFNRLKQFLR